MKLRLTNLGWFILIFLWIVEIPGYAQVRSGDNSVKRIYINISETEKIVAPKAIDDYMTSFAGVAKITQATDKMLLIEAIREGRTTITVICGDDIYRYHLTTFEGRGAEAASVNNEFTEKGYNDLSARFDKTNRDQLLIEGKAESKEVLEDAVSIAKKYTPYVVVKAKVISESDLEVEVSTPDERDIEKTIERIASIPGLKVKVKFEMRQKETNITESATTGNPIVTSTNTTSSGASTSTTAPLLPPDTGGGEPAPVKGTLEQSTITQLEGVPAKIFLFGRVKDDLQRSQAIRVARTFCQLVVSFITVEDPIQIRFQAWIMDVNMVKARNVGVQWPDSLSYRALQGAVVSSAGGAATSLNPASAGASSAGTIFRKLFTVGQSNASAMQNITAGLNTNVDVTINILETEGVAKVLQSPVIMVTNGQTGYFTTGGSFPITNTVVNQGVSQETTTYQDFQTYIQILPLNLERSGPGGETIDILNSDGTKSIPTMMDAKTLLNPVGKNNFTLPPEIDDSLKMVDEFGNIGVRVNVGITSIDTTSTISLLNPNPVLENKSTMTRTIVRDGQPIILSGFYSKTTNNSQRKVPFLGDIPLIGELFKNKRTVNDDVREVMVVLKPTIVRLGSSKPDTIFPEPKMKEMIQMVHDIDPEIVNKKKEENKPYKSPGSASKPALVPRPLAQSTVPHVEQVPLIDVTPATPQVEPIKESPMIRRAETAPLEEAPIQKTEAPAVEVTPTVARPPEAPIPSNLQEEAPAPVIVEPLPVNGPELPAQSPPTTTMEPVSETPVAEVPSKTTTDDQEPTRMKEGPKTRIRPEAPDDSGLIKDQPQTKSILNNKQQEVRNW